MLGMVLNHLAGFTATPLTSITNLLASLEVMDSIDEIAGTYSRRGRLVR